MANDALGKWGTIPTIELPDTLDSVREAVNSIAEVLITFLDIAVQALQLIKAFAFGFIDPIKAIVQATLDLINGLIRDFSQLGIYITHDAALLAEGWPFDALKGGFQAYERRMIGRLTDRTDPTRPDISTDTPVFAGFFYLSEDFSNIQRLIGFVEQLLALFNMKFFPESSLPVPAIDRVDYGSEATGVFGGLSSLGQFNETPPDKVRVTWKVPDPSRNNPSNPLSAFQGPTSYFVTVSTLPDPISLHFDRPEADSGSHKVLGAPQQRREQGQCRDHSGKPIELFGGADQLAFDKSALGWNNAISSTGRLRDGVARCYGSIRKEDSAKGSIIPLEEMKKGTKYFWQRTFVLDSTDVAFQWATREFSLILNYEDMPHHAEVTMGADGKATVVDKGKPSTFYVRVASTTSKVTETGFTWDFRQSAGISGQMAGEPFRVAETHGYTSSSVSAYSAAEKVTFPTGNTLKFLDAIQTALCIMALSRSDLPIIDELDKGDDAVQAAKDGKLLLKEVALERTGLEPYSKLILDMYPDFAQEVAKKGGNQMEFRKALFRAAERLANRLRDESGFTPELEDFVVQNTENLRTVTWRKILIAAGETDTIKQIDQDFAGKYNVDVTPADDTILEHLKGVKRTPMNIDLLNLQADIDEVRSRYDEQEKLATIIGRPPGGPEITEDDRDRKIAALERQMETLRKKFPPASAGPEFGVAANPYSFGIPSNAAEKLFQINGMVRHRKPHFIEFDPKGSQEAAPLTVEASETLNFISRQPPSMVSVYEKFIQPDGSIVIPTKVAGMFTALKGAQRIVGSADMSPIFHIGDKTIRVATEEPVATDIVSNDTGVMYLRSLIGKYENGILYREAAFALQMTGAARLRSPQDGEWIAIRFFDAFPQVEGFFDGIQNWLDALAASIQSITDTLVAYIEFIEARLVELQQLIRRINALIQGVLGYSLNLPQFSGLLLVEDGTAGVVRGLTSAEDKPQDSVLAYGAGVAIVTPLVPGVAGQFIANLITSVEGSPDPDGTVTADTGEDAFGLNGIPEPPPAQGPNDPPDVL